LLRLTHTNVVDLEVTAGVFEIYGLSEYLIHLLAPLESKLTAPLQKTYLRALFIHGRVAEFDRYWNWLAASHDLLLEPGRASLSPASRTGRVPSSSNGSPGRTRPTLFHEPHLQLFRIAFTAGWGPYSAADEAYDALKAHSEESAWRVTAHQLRLVVCEQRTKLDEYLTVLGQLCDWKQDRLFDHVRAWRLLASNGLKQEAVESVQKCKTEEKMGRLGAWYVFIEVGTDSTPSQIRP